MGTLELLEIPRGAPSADQQKQDLQPGWASNAQKADDSCRVHNQYGKVAAGRSDWSS